MCNFHNLGRWTDQPDHSFRNENFTFNQHYPARSVKSWIEYTKEMVFQQKLFEKAFFIVKMTGPAIVRPCSSDLWKASALRSKTQLCKLQTKKFKDKRATTLWLNHIMTCDLTHLHYLLNRSSISAEQPLLLLNVITDRSRLISTSVVPPDTSSWKSSGVRDDISSDGMTSWRPLLIARNSSSTQPNITLVAYNLKKIKPVITIVKKHGT